jgi:hypothetical protein
MPGKSDWCKPSEGTTYAKQKSVKSFRSFFKQGLRHVKLPNGRILTRYSWIDEFLEGFEVKNEAKEMADELVEGFG